MPPAMRPALVVFALAAATLVGTAGCGSEIGDSCVISSDCDPNGTRICDISSDNGYCTIYGCDYGTCPNEAVCVRFFTGSFNNRTCDPKTEDLPNPTNDPNIHPTNDCTPDELCALDGHCVTRASEVRYCMRKCSSQGDCRTNYECRDATLMMEHGGEPVPPPDERLGDNPQPFCAVAPAQ